MPNHRLTREHQRKGGSAWTPAKAETVGQAFEAHNADQRAAAQKRYERVRLLRENGLRWAEVAEFLGESERSVKAVYYRVRDRLGDPNIPTPPPTHCRRGHELAGDNLYERNGVRHCRSCRNLRAREARQRRRRF